MTKKNKTIKKYKIKLQRPNAGYSGALIQQNFGESEKKGFLVWNISSKDDWDVNFLQLENKQPFITIPWKGTVDKTINNLISTRGKDVFMPGARFRISSSNAIPGIETRKLVYRLKEEKRAAEVIFKHDITTRMDHISTDKFNISKKSLRQDPDTLVKLYFDYIASNMDGCEFSKSDFDEIDNLIRQYMSKFLSKTTEKLRGSPKWHIKTLEFDNLFRYGVGNKIDFTRLDGITGIFGPNTVGKSSIIGALMFVLFNTTDRGSMKNAHIINANKNYGKGKIRLSISNVDYIIERKCTRVIPKKKSSNFDPTKSTTTLNFCKVIVDPKTKKESYISLNSISRDETDKEIRKLLGTADDFLDTAFSSQGSINRFIKKGPTDRKKILSRFLELDIFESLYSLCKEDHASLNSRGLSLSPEMVSNKINNLKKDISKSEKNIFDLDEKLKKIREQKDAYKLWLMHHKKIAENIDTGTLSIMEFQVSNIEKTIETTQKEIKDIDSSHKNKKKCFEATIKQKETIDIEKLKTELRNFEEMRVSFQEIKHKLSSERVILENQNKNVKKLNIVPCGDNFPDCHYIKDAHRDKIKISEQNILVDKLSTQFENTKDTFETLLSKNFKEQISNYGILDAKISNLQHEITSLKEKKEYLKTLLKSNKTNLAKLKTELKIKRKNFSVLGGKEFTRKEKQLDDVLQKIKIAENDRHATLVALGGKKESLKNWKAEEAETKLLIKKIKILDSILGAFSKTGIPAMILRTQLPAINNELSKILDGVVDFTITLESEENSNNMDVYINDERATRIIELASGMEKTIASLALRVALINLSSLPKSNIFILDEGFGALDDVNINSCMDMLTSLRGYFKTILIISHLVPIKEIADNIIDVFDNGVHSHVNA